MMTKPPEISYGFHRAGLWLTIDAKWDRGTANYSILLPALDAKTMADTEKYMRQVLQAVAAEYAVFLAAEGLSQNGDDPDV